MEKDNSVYEDGIPEEFLWDTENKRFMKRSLFPGRWVPIRVPVWEADSPKFQYRPGIDRTYQEVVNAAGSKESFPKEKALQPRLATVQDNTRVTVTLPPEVVCGQYKPKSGRIYHLDPYDKGTLATIQDAITLPKWMRTAVFGLRHPKVAIDVGWYDEAKKNISTRAAVIASSEDKNGKILSLEDGGERNALRHGVWQAAITSKYGKDIATQIGNAHENNPHADINKIQVRTIEEADEIADLQNNIIGRKIGAAYPHLGMKEIARKVLDEYYKNGMYVAMPQKGDGYQIQKMRLSEDKYKKMQQAIAQRDENGYISIGFRNDLYSY